MREAVMTAANEAYADRFEEECRKQASNSEFDGWLTAVRAFFFLILGMLVISVLTTI